MGNPGLLQELPDIAALLPEGGRDGEQAAAADRSLAGLDAMADLALNHRLAQGTLGGIVGRLDSRGLQEGPKTIGQLQDLLSGAHCFRPWRSLAALSSQFHHPLQRGLGSFAARRASRSFRACSGASGQTAVAAGRAAPLQIQHWRRGVQRWR
jgi:hypothetical protein